MDTGELVRIALSYSHPNGSVAQNVFVYRLITSDVTDQAVVDALDAWISADWGPDWQPLANTACQLFQADFDILNTNGTIDRNIGQEQYSIDGVFAGDADNPADSMYMQATTIFAKILGKKYVPFIDDNATLDGLVTAASLANLVLLFAEYIKPLAPAGGGTLEPGVLSRAALAFRAFNGGGLVTDVPAYQRRRKPNVGS